MNGKQLAGTLRRNLTDRESRFRNYGFDSGYSILLRSSGQILEASIGDGNLERLEAEIACPCRQITKRVERRLGANELTDEQPWSTDGFWFHDLFPTALAPKHFYTVAKEAPQLYTNGLLDTGPESDVIGGLPKRTAIKRSG
jgi:hypothetical protein